MKNNFSHIKKEEKHAVRIGIATTYDHAKLAAIARTRKARELGIRSYKDLFDVKKFLPETRFEILSKFFPGVIMEQKAFENITPTIGFTQITAGLVGELASLADLEVNVHALGSGSTPAADGDTALETEVARTLLSSKSKVGNKAYYTAVYEPSEAIGTHTEMGLFINGDPGTPDDGILWDRSIVSITKTGAQSLTIDIEDTFTNEI